MKNLLTFIFIFSIFNLVYCQNYYLERATEFLHGNQIRASITNNGKNFFGPSNETFQVPFLSLNSPSTLYLHSLVLGGLDSIYNLKLAGGNLYNDFGDIDYYAGPINPNINGEEACQDFDKIWTVYRYEIEDLQNDLADNGQLGYQRRWTDFRTRF